MASPARAASRNDDGIHAGLTNPDTMFPPMHTHAASPGHSRA